MTSKIVYDLFFSHFRRYPKREVEEEAVVAAVTVVVSVAAARAVEDSVATDSAAHAEDGDVATAEVSVDAARVAEDTVETEDTVVDEEIAVVADAELLVETPAEAATADHLPERRLQLTKILKIYNYNYNNKKHLSNFKQEEIQQLNVCKENNFVNTERKPFCIRKLMNLPIIMPNK